MVEWIEALEVELKTSGNEQRSIAQAAYMKNHFVFCGLESAVRKELAKRWIQKFNLKALPGKEKERSSWLCFSWSNANFITRRLIF